MWTALLNLVSRIRYALARTRMTARRNASSMNISTCSSTATSGLA